MGIGRGKNCYKAGSSWENCFLLGPSHFLFPLCNILLLWIVFSWLDNLWPENPHQTGDVDAPSIAAFPYHTETERETTFLTPHTRFPVCAI